MTKLYIKAAICATTFEAAEAMRLRLAERNQDMLVLLAVGEGYHCVQAWGMVRETTIALDPETQAWCDRPEVYD